MSSENRAAGAAGRRTGVPTNDAIAEALAEYADLLAISGGDAFKVRVYEKAARSVAGYDADVGALDADGLEAIPGVGTSIAAKILEFLDHGSFNDLDEARAFVPAGVRSLLSVPGLQSRGHCWAGQCSSTASNRDSADFEIEKAPTLKLPTEFEGAPPVTRVNRNIACAAVQRRIAIPPIPKAHP